LQRQFNIIAYTDLSFEAINIIYSTIVTAFFATFNDEVRNCLPQLVEAQLEVYD